jgi:hypothetical protein
VHGIIATVNVCTSMYVCMSIPIIIINIKIWWSVDFRGKSVTGDIYFRALKCRALTNI